MADKNKKAEIKEKDLDEVSGGALGLFNKDDQAKKQEIKSMKSQKNSSLKGVRALKDTDVEGISGGRELVIQTLAADKKLRSSKGLLKATKDLTDNKSISEKSFKDKSFKDN